MKIHHEMTPGGIPATIPTGKFAVTLYCNQRLYGGPEEGGWWFTDPFIVQVCVFNSLRQAKTYLKSITPLPSHLRNHVACLEFPGADPVEEGSDGIPVRVRPYNLRDVYRSRELLYTPHYC